MGNDLSNETNHLNGETNEKSDLKKKFQFDGFNRKSTGDNLIFFAGTDKARVISEILEERGWSRTKDHSVTNYTIKWCLAHQVDWTQFQEGKQLINNIPGQLAFSDKINLWYTTRDYLQNRRSLDGNHIQTFLPLTFVLDDENEVADFLRTYRKQNRTWICKPRYSYAGRGIYILSGSSDLNSIFKFKVGQGNRLQYEPRFSGYLMQEYIARPLLIKNRKFDIRVHWLVAWTKPLLVFYNHNASVVRLSLNLYRELDFDRATHLTNLSVQEHHSRYPFAQESTGMTMNQLNHYFNQCFRPFHPKMCQDWVMTMMQERMKTIIRHVIRASKDKLTRTAGQFGLFGCDFLLDENFRIWLLEINDNPGVGWGNTRLNTTTKPLFEETLNIVFECFEKYQNDQTILPIECLKDYQLIYNEDDDVERLIRDDNQLCSEHLAIRYASKETSSRTSFRRTQLRATTSRTLTHPSETLTPTDNTNTDIVLPLINMTDAASPLLEKKLSNSPALEKISSKSSVVDSLIINSLPGNITPASRSVVESVTDSHSIVNATPVKLPAIKTSPLNPTQINTPDEPIEPLKHDDDIQLERLMKPKISEKTSTPKPKPSIVTSSTIVHRVPLNEHQARIKRAYSSSIGLNIQPKKTLDFTPLIINNRRYICRKTNSQSSTETTKKSRDETSLHEKKQQDLHSTLLSSTATDSTKLVSSDG